MSEKSISLQLPDALLTAIDAKVAATGCTRNTLLVETLEKVFGLTTNTAPLLENNNLSDRVAALEKQVANLESFLIAVDRENLPNSITSKNTTKSTANLSLSDNSNISSSQSKHQNTSLLSQKLVNITTKPNNSTKSQPEKIPKKTKSKSTKSVLSKESETPIIDDWMTVREAFIWLGGNPNESASLVTSQDGSRSISFNRFRVLSPSDYKVFGLEFRPDRRHRKLPPLKPLKS